MIRKAVKEDSEAVHNLLKMYARKGLLVPRSMYEIEKNIGNFYVFEENGHIIACAGLREVEEIAEIHSLAVNPNHTGNKIGSKLIEACLRSSRANRIVALTKIPLFFEKFGFTRVNKESLPKYLLEDCFRCKDYEECEAMLK